MISAMKVSATQSDWVGRVIDGRFPLLQWLGGSGRSSVFLTELPGEPPQKAAIKLMPGNASVESRIAFAANASRTHPHLRRLLHIGSCEIDGATYAFVVTEFADEVLSEILPERVLAPDEVKEMLVPVLNGLTELHGHGLVHGRLQPSNILVVNDELKLSADSVQLAGDSVDATTEFTIYDAPERAEGKVAPASDIWSLGVTIIESLTQHTPEWDRSTNRDVPISDAIPQPFAAIVAACLRIDPTRRPSLNEIRRRLGLPLPIVAATPVAAVAKPAAKAEAKPEPQAQQMPATKTQPEPPAKTEPTPSERIPQKPARQTTRPQQKPARPAQQKSAARVAHNPEETFEPDQETRFEPKYEPRYQARYEEIAATHDEAHFSPRAMSRFDRDAASRRKPWIGALLVLVLVLAGAVVFLWSRSHGISLAIKSDDQQPAQSSAPAPVAPQTLPQTHPQPQTQPPILPPTQATPEPEQQPPPPASAPPVAAAATPQTSGASGAGIVKGTVAQKVMATPHPAATRTIHGRLNVLIRVNVSPTGEVADTSYESMGPSKYFAEVARKAARQWKFTPAQSNGRPVASIWTLHFVFTHDNSEVTAEQTAP
jgi:TonB family protein